MNVGGWMWIGGWLVGCLVLWALVRGGQGGHQADADSRMQQWLEQRQKERDGEGGWDGGYPAPSSLVLDSCIDVVDDWMLDRITTYECGQWLGSMTYGMDVDDQRLLKSYIVKECRREGRTKEMNGIVRNVGNK